MSWTPKVQGRPRQEAAHRSVDSRPSNKVARAQVADSETAVEHAFRIGCGSL